VDAGGHGPVRLIAPFPSSWAPWRLPGARHEEPGDRSSAIPVSPNRHRPRAATLQRRVSPRACAVEPFDVVGHRPAPPCGERLATARGRCCLARRTAVFGRVPDRSPIDLDYGPLVVGHAAPLTPRIRALPQPPRARNRNVRPPKISRPRPPSGVHAVHFPAGPIVCPKPADFSPTALRHWAAPSRDRPALSPSASPSSCCCLVVPQPAGCVQGGEIATCLSIGAPVVPALGPSLGLPEGGAGESYPPALHRLPRLPPYNPCPPGAAFRALVLTGSSMTTKGVLVSPVSAKEYEATGTRNCGDRRRPPRERPAAWGSPRVGPPESWWASSKVPLHAHPDSGEFKQFFSGYRDGVAKSAKIPDSTIVRGPAGLCPVPVQAESQGAGTGGRP